MSRQKRRFDPAGADRVDANPHSCIFDPGSFGEPHHPVLGGGVGRRGGQGDRAENRGHIDDGAPALSEHGGDLVFHTVEDAVQVDFYQPAPIFERVVRGRFARPLYACIVDRQMQSAAFLHGEGDHLLHRPRVGDVDGEISRPTPG